MRISSFAPHGIGNSENPRHVISEKHKTTRKINLGANTRNNPRNREAFKTSTNPKSYEGGRVWAGEKKLSCRGKKSGGRKNLKARIVVIGEKLNY